MGHGIKLGQVYSNPFVNAFNPQVTEETQDHEVGMAQGQLDYIIKAATELKQKLGNDEKEIPGWIQDHISKAHSYIHQSNSGYHEYGDEESVNEGYSNNFASWFTGTVLNTVKHPIYGTHKVTPEQIKTAPAEYKNKLFKVIDKAVKNGDVTKDMIQKNESIKLKEISNLTEQNPSFNKWLLQFIDTYITGGEFTKGSPQFQWALSTLLSAVLTDANFHKAATKAKSIFRRAEEPNGSDNLEKLLNNKASEIAKKAKWDGHDIIDGFAYVAAMRIGGPVMQNVTALKNESVNESTPLEKNLVKKLSATIKKRNPKLDIENISSNVKKWLDDGKNLIKATNTSGEWYIKDVIVPIEKMFEVYTFKESVKSSTKLTTLICKNK